jgi:molybdopterin molybdotransferase
MSEPDVTNLITVAQAIAILDAAPVHPRAVELALRDAGGLVAAQDLHADRDYPPFDKSQMDGFAVRAADIEQIPSALSLVGEIPAGQQPAGMINARQTMAIMTGAPLPPGADGVVPIEMTEQTGDTIRILQSTTPARFVARRGSDVAAGATVLRRGQRLGPAQIAVAASVGAERLRVFARPRVAVLASGDELVESGQAPGPAAIRNSNSPMLAALLGKLHCQVSDLGIVRDRRDDVREALDRARASEFDVLFITGGMSMGSYDYVPAVLRELNVQVHITRLRIKPGKPFVFGVRDRSGEGSGFRVQGSAHAGRTFSAPPASSLDLEPQTLNPPPNPQYIFGLPGNPLAAFVCTVRLASRLLNRLGGADPEPRWMRGMLAAPLPANGPREFYQPVVMNPDATVTVLAWKGSADVFTLAQANGLLVRAQDEPAQPAGAMVRVLEV